jgi:small subunit ribosomal protein S17
MTTTKKQFKGIVQKVSGKDTVRVKVERYEQHPKYKKYRTLTKQYLAHDPGNTAKEGDTVLIEETRPKSAKIAYKVGAAPTLDKTK